MDVFPDPTVPNVVAGTCCTILMLLMLAPARKYLPLLHRFFVCSALMFGFQTVLVLAQLLFLPVGQWIALLWIIASATSTGFFLWRSQQSDESVALGGLLACQLLIFLPPLAGHFLPPPPSWPILLIAWCFVSSLVSLPYCWLVQNLLLRIRIVRRTWAKLTTIGILYGLVASVGLDWLWVTHQDGTIFPALAWTCGALALLLILQAALHKIIRQAMRQNAAPPQVNGRS